MAVRTLLAVALTATVATLVAACASDKSADSSDGAKMPTFDECAHLEAAWAAFVEQNRTCVSVSDCTVVGGSHTCDCGYTIGSGSGTAISASAKVAAKPYFDLYSQCVAAHDLGCVHDAAPAKNLRCEAGACRVDEAYCYQPPPPPADAAVEG